MSRERIEHLGGVAFFHRHDLRNAGGFLLFLEDNQSCRETRLLAEHKLDLIEERIADLTRMGQLLRGLVADCDDGERPRSCPIIATLSAGV